MGRPNRRLRRAVGKVIAGGRIYRGRWLHVRIGPSDTPDLLISIRRRYGPAVARNRARRRIRAICRELLADRNVGALMLVSVGDRSAAAGYQALRQDLCDAFRAFGLTSPPVVLPSRAP